MWRGPLRKVTTLIGHGRGLRLAACLLSACALALTGCVNGQDAPPTPTPPAITVRATLDWINASIALPLDAYQMNTSQLNTAYAAQQIVFARCVLGSHDVPAVVLQSASDTLRTAPSPTRWIYGHWDVGFITAQGLGSPWAPPGYGVGQGLTVSPDQGRACVETADYMSLDVIDAQTSTISNEEGNDGTDLLVTIGMTANAQTLADPRFRALAQARADCVKAAGYALDPGSSYQGVGLQDDWTDEQRLKAALAEAECGDGMNFTQQAADINATYQQALIDQHEAELVAIQQLVLDRVARASAVLRSVRVM